METVLQLGDRLKDDRYVIERLLRTAPRKHVYLGRDDLLDCAVVIDVTPFDAAAKWEAKLLGRLGAHPNIATVLNTWTEGGSSYIVTRYLAGGSLEERIETATTAGAPLPMENILDLARNLASAVAHIHARGILYRDLQPRNVLFDEWGNPRLVDFDTAVLLDEANPAPLADGRSTEHMAPELQAGERGDGRADLYSLGTTIIAMCGGLVVDAAGTLLPSGSGSPGRERFDLPADLTALIAELVATLPEDRPATAEEVVRRLEDTAEDQLQLEGFLSQPQSETLAFIPALRMAFGPVEADRPRDDGNEMRAALTREIVTTVAALANTGGGSLVFGLDDAKRVFGIEADFQPARHFRQDWQRAFNDIIAVGLVPEVLQSLDVEVVPFRGKNVALVRVEPRDAPTWVGDDLFVRRPWGTVQVTAKEAWELFRSRRS